MEKSTNRRILNIFLASIFVLSLVIFFGVTISPQAKATSIAPGWSSPALVDPATGVPSASACLNGSNCFAFDNSGNVYRITNSSPPSVVGPTQIDPGNTITAASCILAGTCFAVDAAGNAIFYNGTNWSTPLTIDPNQTLLSVSCANSSYCVAVDQIGNAVVFNGTNWSSPTRLYPNPNGADAINGVSCVSTNNCVYVDAAGSANVGAPGSLLTTNLVAANLTGVSCSGSSFCAAISGSGEIFSYSNATWSLAGGLNAELNHISCFQTDACLATDVNGDMWNISISNGSGITATSQVVDAGANMTTVSCASPTYCVLLDSFGNYSIFNGSSVSTPAMISSTNHDLTSVFCVSVTFCMAGDGGGRALIYDGQTWSSPQLVDSAKASITGVSCLNSTQCVLVDALGNAIVYSNGQFTFSSNIAPGAIFEGISCASGSNSFCMAVTASGQLYNYIFGSSWTNTANLNVAGEASSIWCGYQNNNETCAVVDFGGYVHWLVGMNVSSYQVTNQQLSGIYCSGNSCDAISLSGSVFVGTIGSNLSQTQSLSNVALEGISCNVGSCFAIDSSGNAYQGSVSSTNLAQVPSIDPAPAFPSAISCVDGSVEGTSFCVAVDKEGNALTYASLLPGVFYGETPVRICDTRQNSNEPYSGDTLGPGQTLNVSVLGANNDNVPSDASAVVANITAVDPSSAGFLTVWPTGTNLPNVSTLNFSAGEFAVSNLVEIPIGTNGEISINNAFGSVNVIVDVEGWVAPPNSLAGYYQPLRDPVRVADTRPNSGYQDANSTLAPGASINVTILGAAGGAIPSTGVEAVVANITVTNTTSIGYVVAYPEGSNMPNASTVNFGGSQSVPNRAVVSLGQNGGITITNGPVASTDVIVDVSGYFTSSTGSGGYAYHPINPERIVDTRNGSIYQLSGKTLSAGGTDVAQISGVGEIPSSGVVAALTNVTATNTVANGGFLRVYPYGTSLPDTSDLNWIAGETVANACLATLSSSGQVSVTATNSGTDFIVDAFGWYG